ncbi:MAG: hypothetical protein WAO15_06945, partial [Mycobacterium sp.]
IGLRHMPMARQRCDIVGKTLQELDHNILQNETDPATSMIYPLRALLQSLKSPRNATTRYDMALGTKTVAALEERLSPLWISDPAHVVSGRFRGITNAAILG